MRRLLAIPLVAAALFAVSPAHAQDGDSCTYALHNHVVTVGVCAGVRCNDICAPEPYAYTDCFAGVHDCHVGVE
jgi:hypothetical protein